MMQRAEAPGATLPLQRHSMFTETEKGERLDGEMHSRNLFSDDISAKLRRLLHKSPNRAMNSVNPQKQASFSASGRGQRYDTRKPSPCVFSRRCGEQFEIGFVVGRG